MLTPARVQRGDRRLTRSLGEPAIAALLDAGWVALLGPRALAGHVRPFICAALGARTAGDGHAPYGQVGSAAGWDGCPITVRNS